MPNCLARSYEPYLGLDYKHFFIKGNDDYTQLLPRRYPAASMYLGLNFPSNWGLELGYDASIRESKDFISAQPVNLFTIDAPNLATNFGVRLLKWYLDWHSNLIITNNFNIFTKLGIGYSQSQFIPTAVGGGTLASLLNQLRSIDSFTWRAGIGADYHLSDVLGLRACFRFEGLERIRLNTTNANFAKPWRRGISIATGVFVKF